MVAHLNVVFENVRRNLFRLKTNRGLMNGKVIDRGGEPEGKNREKKDQSRGQ